MILCTVLAKMTMICLYTLIILVKITVVIVNLFRSHLIRNFRSRVQSIIR